MENTQNNVNEINESIAKTPLDKNIKKMTNIIIA